MAKKDQRRLSTSEFLKTNEDVLDEDDYVHVTSAIAHPDFVLVRTR
jgi:hypothetical protein